MKPTPLKNKWNNGLPYIDENVIEDVAAAVECYKKYRDEPMDFKNDFPNEYLEYAKLFRDENWNHMKCWQDWVFDWCFADVVEK